MVTPAHVHADALYKRFRARPALLGVSLLEQGGIVAVLGPNGVGKTTLMRCLATVLAPDDGSLRVDGLDPSRERERLEIRRRLGYLPQETGVVTGASAFDTVEYVAVLKGFGDDRRRRRAVFDALDRVGLADRARDRVGELSVGTRRRVAFAQALLGGPSLLVLDEPAAGLDPDERLRLREILTERRRSATTFVATHLTDEAALADVVIVLDDGRVRFSGSPSQLATRATGRAWVQAGLPPPGLRASWQLADGRHRCLGQPPADAELVEPTIEDGYLLVLDGTGLDR